jgi:signal transduction histidine kinase
LLVAAGLLTMVNNVLPSNPDIDVSVLYGTGAAAMLLGLALYPLPWERWSERAALPVIPVAFALIALSDAYGRVSAFSYAIYFVVAFVWVGLTQPRRTSLWLAPLALLAYLAPNLIQAHPVADLADSTTVAIPVCVLVGEVLAWVTSRQQRAQEALQTRIRVVERLATLSAAVGRDLDERSVAQTLVDCAAETFEGSAMFAAYEAGMLRPIAASRLDPSYLNGSYQLCDTVIQRAANAGEPIIATPGAGTQLPVPDGGCALTVACTASGEILGGLTVILARPPEAVTSEYKHVLSLIGAQAESALLNAAAHRRLIEERRHEQEVVDALVDGVIVVDERGLVHSANRAAAALLGVSGDSLLGRPAPVPATTDEPTEFRVSSRWLEAVATTLPMTRERIVTIRDVGRQHALDEAKDLFLATTSHELRTPLTAIKGYVATLQRHWGRLSDIERRRALGIVDDQTEALIRLTDHLLLGARAASTPAPTQPVDLSSIVADCVAAYAEVSPDHQVRCDVPDNLSPAIGDATGITSVLGQLVENAIKYSPGGGEVIVQARAQPGRIVLDVLDRGIGLPRGREETLFAPFSQGAAVNTRSFSGVGLGLYIVRRLIEAQGGEVVALARPGGGSDFRFWLPAAPTMPARLAPEQRSVDQRIAV